MATMLMAHRRGRVAMRMPATLESGGREVAVTMVSISEGGFVCEGFGLDELGPDLKLRVLLTPIEDADWSPKHALTATEPLLVELPAELLYVDLPRKAPEEAHPTRLGGRFTDLSEADASALSSFVTLELFRRGEWRTRGGAIPLPSR